jgi:hypothetical protein
MMLSYLFTCDDCAAPVIEAACLDEDAARALHDHRWIVHGGRETFPRNRPALRALLRRFSVGRGAVAPRPSGTAAVSAGREIEDRSARAA